MSRGVTGYDVREGLTRRGALALIGASGGALLSGCCSMRGFAGVSIPERLPEGLGTPLKPQVVKSSSAPKFCVDVHAHFFNASDVPVKGYLEGPVAHDLDEPLKSLVKALAPLVDEISRIAPTAKQEYDKLLPFAATLQGAGLVDMNVMLDKAAADHRQETSQQFFEAARGTAFLEQYNAIQAQKRSSSKAATARDRLTPLGPLSLSDAMSRGSLPDANKAFESRQAESIEPYTDGILAFAGFMLSYRWMNLRAYSQAYSSSPGSFGVDHTLGALVDFDRWLDCPPSSGHDDQIRLHELISKLSGGYMLPLVAYNPWTHVIEGNSVLDRIDNAVRQRGFVGVKIYPPNGFRAYGNDADPRVPTRGAPSPADLDKALKKFWDACQALNVPVMAHTGETMGKDDAHDSLGGPQGWEALFAQYRGRTAPTVNLGHFGGDSEPNGWTQSLAKVMSTPDGSTLYGDLGYWSTLRCNEIGEAACKRAVQRLTDALKYPGVDKRVMYGSDWLMLSKERNWATYPFDIAAATKGLISAEALFGGNARSCFGSLA